MYRIYLVVLLATLFFGGVICEVSIAFCTPTTTSLFPFPGNCSRYISCNNGQTTVFECTRGSKFNLELNRCDYEQRVDNCQSFIGNLKNSRISCPKGSSSNVAHPFDCKKFIMCSHGLTYIMDCGLGTMYNALKSTCDWPHNIPGCSGNLGNSVNMRGDVILSSINLNYGSMSFKTQTYVENNYQSNHHQPERQPTYPVQNPTMNHYPPLNYQTTPNTDHQSIQTGHYGVNKPLHQAPSNNGHYSIPNKYPNQNQVTNYPTNSNYNQVTNVYQPNIANTPIKITPTPSSYHPIRYPTENPKNEEDEDLDIDIRMKDDELSSRSTSKILRSGRTALSSDQILAINNLAGPKNISNYTEDAIENVHPQNILESDESHNIFPSTNQLNETDDHIGSSSELHAKIVHFSNNASDDKPLEPIHNYINESRTTERVDYGTFMIFKEDIKSVSSATHDTPLATSEIPLTISETSSTKIIVENVPSINLLNYNYIEYYDNGSVKIDQDYSKIRNHTNSSRPNTINMRENRTIQKLNNKSTGLRKLFTDNSTEDTFLTTLFVTPFKSENDSQHIEVINQFSGQIIRLNGGFSAHRGYIEIRGIGLVGQCDNNWNLGKAHKICKKLGYKRGAKITWKGQTNNAEFPLSSLENNVFCFDDKSEFQTCKLKNISECGTKRDTIGVECLTDSLSYCSENDVPFHKNCYHLVNSSLDMNHEDAVQYCLSRNSSLLYITAQDENDFISEWLTQKYPQVESVMTAGIGFNMLARTIWVWQDSAKSLFNFMKWWPGWRNEKILPPTVNTSASCIVMKNKFPCYDQPNLNCTTDGYFFWDIEDCKSSMNGHYYICKRPYNNIML